jgi:hypothetical protein
MDILAKILGNSARVKIMRLFLINKSQTFDTKEIAKRSRVDSPAVRREVKLLASATFIKKRVAGWYFNPAFKYTAEMEALLIESDTLNKSAILENFKKHGAFKMIVVSGVFIKNKESRVDLLIVGDRMKRGKIEDGIRKLESELGTELVYAIFETKEFLYRLNMYDKLVRDILDFPHEVVFQAKELSTQALKRA